MAYSETWVSYPRSFAGFMVLWGVLAEEYPHWRLGQAAYNTVRGHLEVPDEVNCFRVEENLAKFLTWLRAELFPSDKYFVNVEIDLPEDEMNFLTEEAVRLGCSANDIVSRALINLQGNKADEKEK